MGNDLAMFAKAGLSIAMGNASEEVKRRATHVTASNAEDGFAQAVARYILDSASRGKIA
jgi:hydroxymethylpyrimidine pyrophosphatase-like HAD family hydrolase